MTLSVSNLLLAFVVGINIAFGQFAIAAFARGLEPDWLNPDLVMRVLTSGWTYAAGLSYVIAIFAYISLLRHTTLVGANMPIIAIIVAFNVLFGLLMGEKVTAIQYCGVVLAMASIALIRS